MKLKNNIIKRVSFITSPLEGEGGRRPGEGDTQAITSNISPSSALRASSPSRGEVNGGFTLIELLVVVLIIGILAAVAVPQYQKAVERSRSRQAIELLDSVYKAQQVYFLANGKYARSFAELDIDIPWPVAQKRWSDFRDARANEDWNIEIFTNQWGSVILYVGRNSGPYQGSGFKRNLTGTNNKYTYCVERRSEGITFDASNGSYCQRFFNCTPTGAPVAECSIPVN